jgi:hypothetical protein
MINLSKLVNIVAHQRALDRSCTNSSTISSSVL